MGGRRFLTRGLVAIVAIMVIAPAMALAGKAVTSGQQKLQIKAGLNPARAGARHVTLSFHISYTNPHGTQQPPYSSKTLTITGPFGVHPTAVPACKESVIVKATNKTSGCPAGTKVGTGTIVINASPTIPKPFSGTVTVYNGVNDRGYAGHRKGSRNIFLYARTSVGVSGVLTFYIVKTPGGGTKLVAQLPKPAKPGVTPGSYTIQTTNLSISGGSASKPYLTDPPSCRGSWLFSFRNDNWFNQPSVTAHDRVMCRA